ncbi:MAG: hypothetical protein Q8K65_09605 [Alphaproteobacteria bacterium]|nr:hypothetical protein [Alphaproteobacteria bacterium]
MSIYPKNVDTSRLMYKFDIAALNLPIPDDLTDRRDAEAWRNYVDCLSPAQQIRNFAEALDQFHALAPAGRDLRTASEDEQSKAYSKWMAASCLTAALHGKFHFETEETYRNPDKFYKSDIEQVVHNIVDFLKAVNSPDVQAWEDRRACHRAVDNDSLIALIHKFEAPRGKQTVTPSAPKQP